MMKSTIGPILDLGTKFRDSLRERVARLVGVDGGLRGGFDSVRSREVRLADAEIHWILQTLAQLEHSPHARHLDVPGPVRYPAIDHCRAPPERRPAPPAGPSVVPNPQQ